MRSFRKGGWSRRITWGGDHAIGIAGNERRSGGRVLLPGGLLPEGGGAGELLWHDAQTEGEKKITVDNLLV